MRFLLSLVALCALSSTPLRASDVYFITLTGASCVLVGHGTLTTDGICVNCTPGIVGLLSLTINIDRDTGAAAFDISDDGGVVAQYQLPRRVLTYMGINSETNDFLSMIPGHVGMLSDFTLYRGTGVI